MEGGEGTAEAQHGEPGRLSDGASRGLKGWIYRQRVKVWKERVKEEWARAEEEAKAPRQLKLGGLKDKGRLNKMDRCV